MYKPGDIFNESRTFADPVTGRLTRQITTNGQYNNTPTYHIDTAFTADSRTIVFRRDDADASYLMKADVETGDITVIAASKLDKGGKFGGIALAQASNWFAAVKGNRNQSLRVYHVETLEERVLIDDIGEEKRISAPNGSTDGKTIVVPCPPVYPPDYTPDMGKMYREMCVEKFGGMPTTYYEVDIDTGEREIIWDDPIYGSNHVQHCPTDSDLLMIDRDAPPDFWAGGDKGRTSRVWLLRKSTKALTEIRPRDINRFQVHSNWSHDGEHVYYHSRSFNEPDQNGHYIGAADRTGRILWEGTFPDFHYGHVGSHTQKHAILIDSVITPDLVCAVHYEQAGAHGVPPLEILAKHDTELRSIPGQYSHPHPQMSRDGAWLSYNAAHDGRADVFVVRVG
jgi:hypothetical protein